MTTVTPGLNQPRKRLGIRWWSLVASAACLLGGPVAPASAQTNVPAPAANQDSEEKQACTRNLKQIYEAIQAYQLEQKDLPNWLSDLVPHYLPDANVLVCPVCRRTGRTEGPPLADPKISTSYLFEFCPLALGEAAPNAPTHTRREWKRRQMGLLGSAVPIVRCRHHDPVLNLAFDGRIYESPLNWELAFTNRISAAELTPAHLFARETTGSVKASAGPVNRHFAPRDLNTPKALLDLGPFYNAMLTESWHGLTDNHLAALPAGVQSFAGVQFDVRGLVQLGSKAASATNFPSEVRGIAVRQKCQHLYFLHAAGFGHGVDEGKQIGSYFLHFAGEQTRLEIPIFYGRTVRDWHDQPDEPAPGKELKVAWTGDNPVSKRMGRHLRLFLTTWTNLLPGVEIESLDFVSAMANPAPFLIAITAD